MDDLAQYGSEDEAEGLGPELVLSVDNTLEDIEDEADYVDEYGTLTHGELRSVRSIRRNTLYALVVIAFVGLYGLNPVSLLGETAIRAICAQEGLLPEQCEAYIAKLGQSGIPWLIEIGGEVYTAYEWHQKLQETSSVYCTILQGCGYITNFIEGSYGIGQTARDAFALTWGELNVGAWYHVGGYTVAGFVLYQLLRAGIYLKRKSLGDEEIKWSGSNIMQNISQYMPSFELIIDTIMAFICKGDLDDDSPFPGAWYEPGVNSHDKVENQDESNFIDQTAIRLIENKTEDILCEDEFGDYEDVDGVGAMFSLLSQYSEYFDDTLDELIECLKVFNHGDCQMEYALVSTTPVVSSLIQDDDVTYSHIIQILEEPDPVASLLAYGSDYTDADGSNIFDKVDGIDDLYDRKEVKISELDAELDRLYAEFVENGMPMDIGESGFGIWGENASVDENFSRSSSGSSRGSSGSSQGSVGSSQGSVGSYQSSIGSSQGSSGSYQSSIGSSRGSSGSYQSSVGSSQSGGKRRRTRRYVKNINNRKSRKPSLFGIFSFMAKRKQSKRSKKHNKKRTIKRMKKY